MSLPTVHHLVTTVRGRLRPGVGLSALLRATFPGGSITGAPKIRAMEIIAELEAAARGPYTGATGWLGAAGDLDLAIAIRTALVRDRALTLWVGGGIVADSLPEAELRETVAKAAAFARLAL
jgi:anthranilate/para-aminobenzoate synthase component I